MVHFYRGVSRSTFSTTPFPRNEASSGKGVAAAVFAAPAELAASVRISFPGVAFCCIKSSSLDDAASCVWELGETLGDVGSVQQDQNWPPDAKAAAPASASASCNAAEN